MNVNEIIQAITPAVSARGCFLVETSVGKDNDILITMESFESSVTLEDCEYVNDSFIRVFDKDVEDYSLTVSSAGLDRPFKTLAQFKKALGTKVEISLKGGRKTVATLLAADENSVTVKGKALRTVEGQKRKRMEDFEETFPMEEINSVIPYIEFE